MLVKGLITTMVLAALLVCLVNPSAGILIILAAAVVAFTVKRRKHS